MVTDDTQLLCVDSEFMVHVDICFLGLKKNRSIFVNLELSWAQREICEHECCLNMWISYLKNHSSVLVGGKNQKTFSHHLGSQNACRFLAA